MLGGRLVGQLGRAGWLAGMGLERAFKESLVRPGASVVVTLGSFNVVQNHISLCKSHTARQGDANQGE